MTQTATEHAVPPAPLEQQLQHFALQTVDTPLGRVDYRHAGGKPVSQATLVLLHGIGSASASWLAQLQAASDAPLSVLAWDAPGYGSSAPVGAQRPQAHDYARHVWAWLDALQVHQPVTLVGHSLGAIMASAAARMAPERVQALVLLSPARGYGQASAAEREQKRNDRLHNLATLGPQGMAQKRGAAMLSPHATTEQITFIQGVMAQIQVAGYTQATHLLADADLLSELAHVRCPVRVASGRDDSITPEAACREVAAAAGVPWHDLGTAGHACALEAATAVNTFLGLPSGDPL